MDGVCLLGRRNSMYKGPEPGKIYSKIELTFSNGMLLSRFRGLLLETGKKEKKKESIRE